MKFRPFYAKFQILAMIFINAPRAVKFKPIVRATQINFGKIAQANLKAKPRG
ncbi:hypothetical protein [uncultured Campylobacter sp.]|uniref:hypothetical protein n=1 Tax=uncultured Campylobacter sp. TaxID=218934 RepID=UPI0026392BD9|nr:hypothetical protein [uncultured Campylobacter sp.]